MYHILSRVKSGGGATYLFAVAGRIACKDASLFDAFSGPWRLSNRNGTILVAKERPTPPLYPSRLKNALVLYHIPSVARLPTDF